MARIAAKEAECAAMRRALEKARDAFKEHLGVGEEWRQVHRAFLIGDIERAEAALASNAGADLLARLRAAEEKAAALVDLDMRWHADCTCPQHQWLREQAARAKESK